MDQKLREELQAQLKRNAERLARFAAMPNCPLTVLGMSTKMVVRAAMHLCGDDVAKALFHRIIERPAGRRRHLYVRRKTTS